MKVKIKYPQIYMESMIIEVSEEEYQEAKECDESVTNFIWEKMGDFRQSHTLGKKMIESFVDDDFATLKPFDEEIDDEDND